jgi:hypothetical protein
MMVPLQVTLRVLEVLAVVVVLGVIVWAVVL